MSSLNRFRDAYESTPPWDIGRPQIEIVRLEEKGEIMGSVLDIGCGTGENAVFLAARHNVTGIDGSPSGIAKAKQKAKDRKTKVTFKTADALKLEKLGKKFDTIIDSALFHVFTDEETAKYEKSLRTALKKNGNLFVLCFSDKDKENRIMHPRRISSDEITSVFKDGWKINYIKEAVYETRKDVAKAYLVSIKKAK
jgi:cyclopropane fatty-acyl-phospholipid synthase-like methyltransferase